MNASPVSPSAIVPLPAELRFVAECIRRSAGAPPRQLPVVFDWNAVVRHTTAQSMFGSVAAALKSDEVAAPSNVRELIATGAAMASLQRRHRQEAGIQRVLKVLLEEGCTPVVLKGVAHAYSRYAVAEHRTFADLDVLLPKSQLALANRLLQDSGFTVDARDQLTDGHQHLPALHAPGHAIVVELHRALYADDCPFVMEPEELLARARPISVLGLAVRELAPTDALLHTCSHLSYGHQYKRFPLRSLADVLVLTLDGEMDWAGVVYRARRARMGGAIVWPLALARAWLGAPVPEDVLRSLAPSRPLRRLVAPVMYSGYVLDRGTVPDDGTKVLFDLVLDLSIFSDCSVRTQVEVLLRRLFPRSDGVQHLPPQITASPTNYALALTRLTRLRRGVEALGRLMSGTSDRQGPHLMAGTRPTASLEHDVDAHPVLRPHQPAPESHVGRTANARSGSVSLR